MKKGKILLANLICIMLFILFSGNSVIIASDLILPGAPNQTNNKEWQTVVHYGKDQMVADLAGSTYGYGYMAVDKDEGFDLEGEYGTDNTESNILGNIYKYLATLSYGFDANRKDTYINKWYDGDNGTGSKTFEELKNKTITNINCIIQWTDQNTVNNDSVENVADKKIYIARIHMWYDGNFGMGTQDDVDICIFTNPKINNAYKETIQNEFARQKQQDDAIQGAYKTKPGQNASANEIWLYFQSVASRPETERNKIYEEQLRTDKSLLSAWQKTIGPSRDPRFQPMMQIISELLSDKSISDDAEEGLNNQVNNRMKLLYANLENDPRGTVVFNDVLTDLNTYTPGNLDPTSSNKIETVTSKILTIITNIGIAVSVIMLATLGIKYMLGSVEEKAEYKQSLIPYVVGAFILFGITSFIKILMSFGNLIAGI